MISADAYRDRGCVVVARCSLIHEVWIPLIGCCQQLQRSPSYLLWIMCVWSHWSSTFKISLNCWSRNYYFIPFVIIILPWKTRRSSFSLDLLIYIFSESIIILPVKLPCLLVLFFFPPLLIMVVLYSANKPVYSSLITSFWSFYYFTFCLRRESNIKPCMLALVSYSVSTSSWSSTSSVLLSNWPQSVMIMVPHLYSTSHRLMIFTSWNLSILNSLFSISNCLSSRLYAFANVHIISRGPSRVHGICFRTERFSSWWCPFDLSNSTGWLLHHSDSEWRPYFEQLRPSDLLLHWDSV